MNDYYSIGFVHSKRIADAVLKAFKAERPKLVYAEADTWEVFVKKTDEQLGRELDVFLNEELNLVLEGEDDFEQKLDGNLTRSYKLRLELRGFVKAMKFMSR